MRRLVVAFRPGSRVVRATRAHERGDKSGDQRSIPHTNLPVGWRSCRHRALEAPRCTAADSTCTGRICLTAAFEIPVRVLDVLPQAIPFRGRHWPLRRTAGIVFRGRDAVALAGRRHFLAQPFALLAAHAPSGRGPVLEAAAGWWPILVLATPSGGSSVLTAAPGGCPVLLLRPIRPLTAVPVTAAPLLRVRLGGERASSRNDSEDPQESLHDVMMVRVRTPTVCPTNPKFVTIRCRVRPSLQPVSARPAAAR